MLRLLALVFRTDESAVRAFSREVQTEFLRKGIHLLVAMVPLIAAIDRNLALGLLGVGLVIYTISEFLRMRGITVPLVSRLTAAASRFRDHGRFVLGPVTLGFGAFTALLLFPPLPAAIAVYALAFGDGVASLAGKLIGRIRIPWTGGKSLEGTLACFVAVAFAATRLVPVPTALILSAAAALLEVLPTGDFDNLLLPLGVGTLAVFLL